MMPLMLLRLAYLGTTNAFALLRLLPGGNRDKDIEILSLRHQLAVLQRQLDGQRVRFEPVDRAWLAGLLHPLPRPTLRGLRLLVRPDTILKWHRDLIARRQAAHVVCAAPEVEFGGRTHSGSAAACRVLVDPLVVQVAVEVVHPAAAEVDGVPVGAEPA
jgi:hypothetical protein